MLFCVMFENTAQVAPRTGIVAVARTIKYQKVPTGSKVTPMVTLLGFISGYLMKA